MPLLFIRKCIISFNYRDTNSFIQLIYPGENLLTPSPRTMSGKKKTQLVKYCRIFQWVEEQDSDFAGAIRDLCLEGMLSAGRHSSGVTFLYPKEKSYRQEIIDKAYGEDADEAIKMVESLIIPDALLNGADFKDHDIGSRLGVKFDVKSAGTSKVELDGGVELGVCESFRTLSKRAGSLAVWYVTNGRLPLTGEAYSPPRSGPKRGGARHNPRRGGNYHVSARESMARTVEAEYAECMQSDRCVSHDPYLCKVVSLLNFIKVYHPKTLAVVLPMLDYNPFVTFYLLLEPYKTTGNFIIPEGVLFGGSDSWCGVEMYKDAVNEYKAFFRSMSSQLEKSATGSQSGIPVVPHAYINRAGVGAQIDAARQTINANKNPRSALKSVREIYNVLATQNYIRGMGPVLPDVVKMAQAGAKKLWQDEFRFTIHEALEMLKGAPYEKSTLDAILGDIKHKYPGNDYENELVLCHASDISSNVGPRIELIMLMKFINSSDFLYLPVSPDSVGGTAGSMDPSNWKVYNRNAAAILNLKGVQGMVRAAGISPKALAELQLHLQLYGDLPSEVMAIAASK